MSKIVPLVIYKDGRSVTVGTAEVHTDGQISAQINDSELTKEMLGVGIGSFSITPFDTSRTKMCWACAMGKCRDSEQDNTCVCCLNEHHIL